MAEDRKPLEEQVVKWLATEGYRLEYQTLKAMRDARLQAVLGNHIKTGKGTPREIDVTVSQTQIKHQRHNVVVRCVCECKYVSGKPWVLLDSDQSTSVEDIWKASPKSQSVGTNNILQHLGRLNGSSHFPKECGFAHTVLQAWVRPPDENDKTKTEDRKSNRDFAFDSLQKIANAAWDSAEEDPTVATLAVVIPCIVIDGPLLIAKFNYETNEFEASKTAFHRLLWSGARSATVVDVVNIGEIKSYAAALRDTFERLNTMMMQEF